MTIYGRVCNANAPPRLMYHNLDAVAATRAPLWINVRAFTSSMSVSFWEKGQVMKQPMLLQALITHGRAREIERDVMCRQRYRLWLPGSERERREVSAALQAVITRAERQTWGVASATGCDYPGQRERDVKCQQRYRLWLPGSERKRERREVSAALA